MADPITRELFGQRNFRESHGPYTTAAYDPHTNFPNGGDFTIRQVSTTFTDPATSVQMIIEATLDGGTNWFQSASSGVQAGGQIDRHGNPVLAQVGGAVPDMSDPRYAGFRLRGRLLVTGVVNMALVADITKDDDQVA